MTEIAVTGATGQLGGRVARMLCAAGVPQRLVARDPARAPTLDGARVAVADLGDVESLTRALDDVGTLFLVSAHEARDRLDLHRGVVRAVVAAGVRRVVYTSFMGASPHATFTYARDHAHTERALREAGVAVTALRSSLYADVVPWFVGDDDVVRGPAGVGRCAFVARTDVARLAVAALLDDAHADQVYDVSGPRAVDLHEAAEDLSRVLGRAVRYQPETLEEARLSRAGAPDWQVDGWVGSYAAIATGETSVTSHTVEAVTGRRPMSLPELLDAEPATWEHLRR